MPRFASRWKLVLILGAILIAGFVGVNLANYLVSSQSVRSALINNELPLTSNNIYSEIQASLLRPIYISSLMANDTFLKDWVIEGENDLDKITRYLTEIQKKYQVASTFLVSAKTLRYYHTKGILKTVSPNVPKDSWFFTMKSHEGNYRVDVDANEANRNQLTIFVNHKLHDFDGNFIGVTGLGLDVVNVAAMIDRYTENYQRNIYFVDRQGFIKSHHDESMIDTVNILKMPGVDSVAKELLAGDNGFLIYHRDRDTILLSYRFIPELNWFLLVEQPEDVALEPLRRALFFNLLISAAITLLVMLISGFTVHRFQNHLENMARTDKLTGLFNRQYFDVLFAHVLSNVGRHTQQLSLALFDIDYLKQVNDREGHLSGDQLIQSIALLAREHIRKNDVIARWGGDEFAILFQNCDAKTAVQLMDKIRQRILATINQEGDTLCKSISVGVAEFVTEDTCETLLSRADAQLYEAKRKGRNRVEG
ncbi:sensor domain-containing diguanylate cyclase [Sedimenticola sp.]|uniref:sensor domain-containing diguanylate cyclase n=1 Tax=Sedimenticola sp. TaxID=1940285 RepID=UPI003D0DC0AF